MDRPAALAQPKAVGMSTDILELVSFVFSPAIPHLMALLLLFVIVFSVKQHLYSQ